MLSKSKCNNTNLSQELSRLYLQSEMHALSSRLRTKSSAVSKQPNTRTPIKFVASQNNCPYARAMHKLRVAIVQGNSRDAKTNANLKRAIKQAKDMAMPAALIQQTIDTFNQSSEQVPSHLLQLRFQRNVYLICPLRTNDMKQIKLDLVPLLREFNGAFACSLRMFHSCGIIESLISFRAAVDFSNLESTLAADAIACNAEGVEIIKYETGAVNFKCQPLDLPEVRAALENKGYQVLHTEYGFSAKNTVKLTPLQLESYTLFLKKLRKIADVVQIYDNVAAEQKTNEAGSVSAKCADVDIKPTMRKLKRLSKNGVLVNKF